MNLHLSTKSTSAERPRSLWSAGLAAIAGLAIAAGSLAGAQAATVTAPSDGGPALRPSQLNWRPRFVTLRHPRLDITALRTQAAAGATVPFWTSNITSPLDRRTYTTSMVGSSPFAASKTNTVVSYVPIVLKIRFRNGTVLDPTAPALCDTVPVETRFFNSPMFQPVSVSSNGVNVSAGAAGGTQVESAFQRANFWSSVAGSGYGVTLTPSRAPIVLTVNAPAGASIGYVSLPCGGVYRTVPIGEIGINQFDALIESLIHSYATPAQLPIFLTYDVVQTENGCCIIGYHNAVPVAGGTQTYAVGSYVDTGIFQGIQDVSVWSHELGEWMDDPFVQASVPGGGSDDLTPAWGNVGQDSGCQNNLEVGDPLTGTLFAIAVSGGFTYHIQDLAFHDWFYRTAASGTGGKYSFMGVFTTTQRVCS